jgi:hypothetical protein
MPAKKIIFLERTSPNTIRYLLWLDVPAARQAFYARPGAVSKWTGAQPADNTALQSGAVVEREDIVQVPLGAPAAMFAQAKTDVIAIATAAQADLTTDPQLAVYGTFWDGTTWTAGGVA